MHETARKEQFSRAYVQAVAATAGFAWSSPSVDDDSIDMTLAARGGKGTIRSPRIDLQLKCHAHAEWTQPTFTYPLEIKNYNDLRDTAVMVPRILVIVVIPTVTDEWILHSEHELALRRCGYWTSLFGLPPTENQHTVSIEIDRRNQFHADGLTRIMQRVSGRGQP